MTLPLQAEKHWVFFGTSDEHIYVSSFDTASGDLSVPRQAAEVSRPGFLAVHPSEAYLYAVGRESSDGGPPVGFAQAYAIDRSNGALSELNRIETGGAGAAHVAVDARGRTLVAANYGDGSVVSATVLENGRLGELVSSVQHRGSSVNPERQKEPHPHSANYTPDGRFVVVPDLGTDELAVYSIDPQSAELQRNRKVSVMMAPGSGPRHLTFHPNGRWAYVINEMASTVTALSFDSSLGDFKNFQTISTLTENYSGPENSTAEVLIHPNGRILYGSNRGDNSLAVFSINPADGRLSEVERVASGGDWPRNFRIDPSGKFLLAANQRSNDVSVFRIDSASGKLTPSGSKVELPAPICVRFVRAL